MKELTIEDKAKRYDEAVKKLQEALSPTEDGQEIAGLARRRLEKIFPELKESELQEVSYYIPEGFHAEIEANKVVIKKNERKPTWSEVDYIN